MLDNAVVRYSIPMPNDSPIPGRDAEEMALNDSVLSTVKRGGLGDCTANFSGDILILKTGLRTTHLRWHDMVSAKLRFIQILGICLVRVLHSFSIVTNLDRIFLIGS